MFEQLVMLTGVGFLTGTIALVGALMHIPQPKPYNDAWISGAFDRTEDQLISLSQRVTTDKMELRGRVGQSEQQIRDLSTSVYEQWSRMDNKVQKIGDDLYRHLSLQQKKPRGTRK